MKNSLPKAASRLQAPPLLPHSLSEATFIVFDIETTGGNPSANGITEICALRFHNGTVVDTFYTLVNPETPIPGLIRRMTGITPAMVKDAPVIASILPELLAFLGDSILVSHNTQGDLTFLRYFALKYEKVSLENFYLCTHLLGEKMWPESPRKNLGGLAEFLGVELHTVHRAQADTHLTLELFKRILARFDEVGVHTLEEAIRFQGDYESLSRISWAIPAEVIAELPSCSGIFSLYDRTHTLLFSSSAANLKKDLSRLVQPAHTPKKLLKHVVRAHFVQTHLHANLFCAMVEEAGLPQEKFSAPQWHMRNLTLFVIRYHEDQATLTLSADLTDADLILGPIYDRRKAQEHVEEMAFAFDSRPSRKKVYTFTRHQMEAIVATLTHRLEAVKREVKSQHNPLSLLFNSKKRAHRTNQLQMLELLEKIPVSEKYSSLLKVSGVISCKRLEEQDWFVYPVCRLQLGEPVLVQGSWETWLQDTPEGQSLMERVQQPTKFSTPALHQNPQLCASVLWAFFAVKEAKKQGILSTLLRHE
jgi:DNA polymerase III epsilon subunit family exonuclease